nr:hypothetical protein [Actinophytocola xanthii]
MAEPVVDDEDGLRQLVGDAACALVRRGRVVAGVQQERRRGVGRV